jgi:hypothetical protein
MVDYAYYKDTYLGNQIAEDEFPRLESRAVAYLTYLARGRIDDSEPAKMACCAVAEQYQVIDTLQTRAASAEQEKQSESVGSWSVSYRSGTEAMQEAKAQLKAAAEMYLANTGMLYRGGRCCGCDCPTL